MALIERLMQWGEGGTPGEDIHPDAEPHDRFINIHEFEAANILVLTGDLTVAQVKTQLDMTGEDNTDYDAIIALVTAETLPEGKHRKAHEIAAHIYLGSLRTAGFTTPADVRTRLGI